MALLAAIWSAPAMAGDTPTGFPMAPSSPAGAPNVIVVMTDDVGFGASSTFGGPIETATADALAAQGLRYNSFHTTAMCSPTRAALLTGRNHHAVNNGAITNIATPMPGYNSVIPDSAATIADVLRANGYVTAWFGKNHNTPEWEITPAGPFDRWPTGYGFDHFYGFIGGATNQFEPALVEDNRLIAPPLDDPGYILDRDLADRAIAWIDMQTSVRPDAPFLMYVSPGSPHSPHQAPAEWIERFRGRFDQGWDRMREETLARQIEMGIVPEGTELTPRPKEIPAWDSLSPEARRVAARMMEIYAAQLSHFDYQLGRVLDELVGLGRLDNTLIVYVQGDNGASAEGGLEGMFSDIAGLNGIRPTLEEYAPLLEELGTSISYGNYPAGWAWAMNTPFSWTKQIASHFGGTRNGLVVSWPRGIRRDGEVRTQFHHVIDIAPTIYEAAGITPPDTFEGVEQQPIDGVSMVYSFDHAEAPSRRTEQYFELLGNRAYYRDGWMASTTPGRVPWTISSSVPAEEFAWELYDLGSDFSQANDLAEEEPERLAELQAAFLEAAERYDVLPLDSDFAHRIPSSLRPYVFNGRTSARFANGETRYPDQSFPDIKNRSWTIEADVVVAGGENGTIVTQGGWVAGWGLFLFDGRPTFLYKQADGVSEAFRLASSEPLAPGSRIIGLDFAYDGGGRGRGGELVMRIDGTEVARGRIDRTVPSLFVGEGASIGRDYGTPLTADYRIPFVYPGAIEEVRIDFGDEQASR